MIDSTYLYQCSYCKKRFMKERFFMAHECEQMKRSREVQSLEGQQAYQLYRHWLEKQRRKAPPVETFVTSAYYTSFMKFIAATKALGIGDPKLYIDLMVERNYSPALWLRDECYHEYISYVDKKLDPYKQAEMTLNELIKTAAKLDVELPVVFAALEFGELLQLVNQRRLSPWILFCSIKFKERMTAFDEEQRKLLLKAMGMTYWSHAFEQKPEVVKAMKELVAEVGL